MPDIDLTQKACDGRLLAALIFVTEHTEALDLSTWGVCVQPHEFAVAIARQEWPCGTTACLAGAGVIQAGLARVEDAQVEGEHCLALTGDALELLRANGLLNYQMMDMDFGGIGQLLFGLDTAGARQMFYDAHDVPSLWLSADHITRGRVRLPEALMPTVWAIEREQSDGLHLGNR